MKLLVSRFLSSALISLLCVSPVFSQKKSPHEGCMDPNISAQAEGLKAGYLKKGMMVYRESMISMASMEPTPIVVRLVKDQLYQFIFIGSENASKLTFELFDGQDKRIDEKRMRNGNILYTFKPNKTDEYLINLYQKKGMRDLCGYFGILIQNTHKPAAPGNPSRKPAR